MKSLAERVAARFHRGWTAIALPSIVYGRAIGQNNNDL
jgi:hypothetical protein